MKRLSIPLLRQNKAVSTAISAIVITAITVALVMVVAFYAYQVLEQQRGAAEFDVAEKSILAFDDALQDVAWKPNASRMVRFKVEYGALKLIPNATTLIVSASIGDSNATPLASVSTGFIRYSIGTRYVTFGEPYESCILGNNESIVSSSAENPGKVKIEQQSGLVNVTLSYRARALKTLSTNVNGTLVNYVTIWLINVTFNEAYPTTHIHSFDLKARCIAVPPPDSIVYPYDITDVNCVITVESEGKGSEASVTLDEDADKVVFSIIVAEVKVSV